MAVTLMSQAKVRATAFSTSGRITDFAQLGTVHLSNLSLMSGEAKVLMVSWFGLTVSRVCLPQTGKDSDHRGGWKRAGG